MAAPGLRSKPGTKPCVSRRRAGGVRGPGLISSGALKFGDELGGHLVAGHVDGIATVVGREDMTEMARFVLRTPREFVRFRSDQRVGCARWRFSHGQCRGGDTFLGARDPHTLHVTTFGALHKGDDVNLEVDTMARYAARLAEMK